MMTNRFKDAIHEIAMRNYGKKIYHISIDDLNFIANASLNTDLRNTHNKEFFCEKSHEIFYSFKNKLKNGLNKGAALSFVEELIEGLGRYYEDNYEEAVREEIDQIRRDMNYEGISRGFGKVFDNQSFNNYTEI